MAFVSSLLAGAPSTLADGAETELFGCPVRAYNEFGLAQDRLLVLTTHALWRIDYSEPWARVDHHIRIDLATVASVAPRPRHGAGGFALELTQPDSKPNALTAMILRRGEQLVERSRARAGKPIGGGKRFERAYAAVARPGQPAAPLRELLVASIEACCKLLRNHMGSVDEHGDGSAAVEL